MTIAVLMFLGSVESLYHCVTDFVTRWAKIISFLSSSQADLCACCLHIWPIHLLQQCWSCHKTLPLSICELLVVLCTLHTSDPACPLQGKLIFLSHPFYTVTLCVRVKIQKLLHKSTSQWEYEVHPVVFSASISKPCQWSWRDNQEIFWLVCLSIMFKISSEIKSEKASCGVFAFLASSTHPGRRTIMFFLRAWATLGGVLLQ